MTSRPTRSPTASAATGCGATPTGCPPPTARCTSTPRASAWSTPTSRCRSRIPTSRTTRTSRATSTTTSTTSASATASASRPASSTPRGAPDGVWEIALDERLDAPLRRAAGRQRPPLGRALARAGVPRRRRLRGRADPLARLQGRRPGLLPRQDRRRARDGQLGDGHRGRGELRREPHLPRRPPRRARDPEVPVRQADRPDRRLDRRSRSRSAAGSSQGMLKVYLGDMERYGLPKPDHRFGDAHPTISDDILSRMAHGTITREAEHRLADPQQRALRRRLRGRGRRRRLLHGLQGHVPVLRRGLHRRARQRPAAVPPHVPPRHPERVLHRAAAAARRDHADRRGAVGVGQRLPRRPLRAARPGRAARGHRGRAAAHVQALRRLQAPHDAGRLRRLDGRDREGAQGGAGARASGRLPAARGAARTRPVAA